MTPNRATAIGVRGSSELHLSRYEQADERV